MSSRKELPRCSRHCTGVMSLQIAGEDGQNTGIPASTGVTKFLHLINLHLSSLSTTGNFFGLLQQTLSLKEEWLKDKPANNCRAAPAPCKQLLCLFQGSLCSPPAELGEKEATTVNNTQTINPDAPERCKTNVPKWFLGTKPFALGERQSCVPGTRQHWQLCGASVKLCSDN